MLDTVVVGGLRLCYSVRGGGSRRWRAAPPVRRRRGSRRNPAAPWPSSRRASGSRAVEEVEQGVRHPRAPLDLPSPGTAHALVARQHGLEVVHVGAGEQRSQSEGILNGGVRALPVVGQHPVGGVAEHDDAPPVPPQQWAAPNSAHRSGLAAARIISVTAGCQPRNEPTGTSSPTSITDASCIQILGVSTTAKKLTDSPLPSWVPQLRGIWCMIAGVDAGRGGRGLVAASRIP